MADHLLSTPKRICSQQLALITAAQRYQDISAEMFQRKWPQVAQRLQDLYPETVRDELTAAIKLARLNGIKHLEIYLNGSNGITVEDVRDIMTKYFSRERDSFKEYLLARLFANRTEESHQKLMKLLHPAAVDMPMIDYINSNFSELVSLYRDVPSLIRSLFGFDARIWRAELMKLYLAYEEDTSAEAKAYRGKQQLYMLERKYGKREPAETAGRDVYSHTDRSQFILWRLHQVLGWLLKLETNFRTETVLDVLKFYISAIWPAYKEQDLIDLFGNNQPTLDHLLRKIIYNYINEVRIPERGNKKDRPLEEVLSALYQELKEHGEYVSSSQVSRIYYMFIENREKWGQASWNVFRQGARQYPAYEKIQERVFYLVLLKVLAQREDLSREKLFKIYRVPKPQLAKP